MGAIELLPFLFPNSIEPTTTSFRSVDLPALLNDLAKRFSPTAENDGESGLEEILGPVVQAIGNSLVLTEADIGGGGKAVDGRGWRESLEVIVSLTGVKSVAAMFPSAAKWDILPTVAGGVIGLELFSLLGPFLRLSTFPDAYVSHCSLPCRATAMLNGVAYVTAFNCKELFPCSWFDGSRRCRVGFL